LLLPAFWLSPAEIKYAASEYPVNLTLISQFFPVDITRENSPRRDNKTGYLRGLSTTTPGIPEANIAAFYPGGYPEKFTPA